MSSSNCCFLTCIQISQEAGQVVWYSHLFQNYPQFVVMHTVKRFGIVKKAGVDVFCNSLAFLRIQQMLAICSLVPLPFLKPAWASGSSRFMVHVLMKSGLENFEHYFASMWDEWNCAESEHSLALPFFGIGMKTDHFQSFGLLSGNLWLITKSTDSSILMVSIVLWKHHGCLTFKNWREKQKTKQNTHTHKP